MKKIHKYSSVFVVLTISIFLLNISPANAALSGISPIRIINPIPTPTPTPTLTPAPLPTPTLIKTPITTPGTTPIITPIITPIKSPSTINSEVYKLPLGPVKPTIPGNINFKPINPDLLTKIPPLEKTEPDTKTPEPIKINLTATVNSNAVSLQWVATGGTDEIAAYYVFRGTSPGGENATPINSDGISGTSYNDSGATNGTFYYLIAPLLKDGTWETLSNETSVTLSKEVEINIELSSTVTDNSVSLQWNSTGSVDQIKEYYVFRGITAGGQNPNPINSDGLTDTTFTDKGLSHGTFFYAVYPLLKDGTWGGPSNETSVKVGAPSQLTLSAQRSGGGVALNWTSNIGSEQLTGYFVFRGTTPAGEDQTPINSAAITETSYTDTAAAGGTNYYVVAPLLKDGSWGTVSNEAYITLGSTIVLQIGNPVISVNGEQRYVDPNNQNVTPMIIQNRTLLPIRAIIEALGGTVDWDSVEQKITVELNDTTVKLWIGRSTALVSGATKSLDVAPQIVNNRTLLPLRFVAENLNCDVAWNGENQSVTITQE